MRINFLYNWPIGKNAVSISFGAPTIQDKDYRFRIAVIKKEEPDKIYSPSESEWLASDQLLKLKFILSYGDKIILDRKSKNLSKASRLEWNTSSEWPSEAVGPSSVNVFFDF